MGKPLPTNDQAVAAWTNDGASNVTTTIVKKTIPTGAVFVDIGLYKRTATAATALWLYVVYNAVSDAEAAAVLTNLAVENPQRTEIPIGLTLTDMQRLQTPNGDPITRIDFKTDAATETPGNRVVIRFGGQP